MPRRHNLFLALVACFGLAQVANAAAIDVRFVPIVDAHQEWAVEIRSDTPIASAGIFIVTDYYETVTFTSQLNLTPPGIIGMFGVAATIDALEDPTAPWLIFGPSEAGLPGGVVNAHPGSLASSLGPVDTWLALGLLTAYWGDIEDGEGVETYMWGDPWGTLIAAADVNYTVVFWTVPEPGTLMLLGLGFVGLAFLRRHQA